MASPENSNISTSSHPPVPSSSILNSSSHFVTIKVTLENYLLWKAQIVPFLKGHQLHEYVDGSLPATPPVLNNLPNPAYTKWLLQDQLIISALNASLFDSVLAQVLNCSTSHEVWSALQTLFAAKSTAHIMQTKYQLARLKKGSFSIAEYFNKATSLSSTLSAAGQPLTSSEFSIYILPGFGTDYE